MQIDSRILLQKRTKRRLRSFLSKPQAWYIITARSAVHIISPFGLYLITRRVYFPAA